MGFEPVTAAQKPANLRGRAAAKWYADHNLTPPAKGDTQPRRTAARKPKLSHAKLVAQIGGGAMMLQGMAFMAMGPELQAKYGDDALSMQEIALLADALADEVLANAYLSRMFAQLDKVGPHGKLLMVCASIAIPRLARHGVIPRELEAAATGFAQAAVSLGAGSAHDADRGHREREVNDSVGGAEGQSGYSDLPNESRFGEVRHSDNGFHDEADVESEVQPDRTQTEPAPA